MTARHISVFSAILVAVGNAVGAETQSTPAMATARDLAMAAVESNAGLSAMRQAAEAAAARADAAGYLPDPMVRFSTMDDVSGGYDLGGGAERRIEIEQPLPWFGKRGLEGEMAAREADVAAWDFAVAGRDLVLAVKETCYELRAVRLSRDITRDERTILGDMESAAENRLAAAQGTQADVLRAQTESAMLGGRLSELDALETALAAKLDGFLNRKPGSGGDLTIAEESAPAIPGAIDALIEAATANREELHRAAAMAELGSVRSRAARKQSWPDWKVGAEYRSIADSDDMLMVSVAADIPLWQGKLAASRRAAQAEVDSAESSATALRIQVEVEVRTAYAEAKSAAEKLRLYRDNVLPQAIARVAASDAAYRSGAGRFDELLESERFLLNARIMAVMAESDLLKAAARLDRAVAAGAISEAKPQSL